MLIENSLEAQKRVITGTFFPKILPSFNDALNTSIFHIEILPNLTK